MYLFDGLAAGDYVVAIAPDAFAEDGPLVGKVSSTPTVADPNSDVDLDDNGTLDDESGYVLSGVATLGDGEPEGETPSNDAVTPDGSSNLTVDFGFFTPESDPVVPVELFSIGNQVWMDSDNDGLIGDGEMAVADVVVELFAADEGGAPVDQNGDGVIDSVDAVASTVTDAEGLYLFDGLAAGDYVVAIAPDAFAEDGPLAGKIPSSTATDADTDLDNDNNGVAYRDIGYVLSDSLTLGDGEPGVDASSNLTVDFGFYEPDFALRIEMSVVDGLVDGAARVGEPVTFLITVTNDGDLEADDIRVQVSLSGDLEMIDADWTALEDQLAVIEMPGAMLPGEAKTIELTVMVAGDDLVAVADIASAEAIDENGLPLTSVLGVSLSNSNTLSSTLGLSTATDSIPVLAFTGVESKDLTGLAMLILTLGLGLVFASGRNRRDLVGGGGIGD